MSEHSDLQAAPKRSICIFSLSCIPDDPRVRRQGNTFHEAGWTVHAFGINEPKSALPAWSVHPGNWSPPAAVSDAPEEKRGLPIVEVKQVEIEIAATDVSAPPGRVARMLTDASKPMKETLPEPLFEGLQACIRFLISLYWGFRKLIICLIALYWTFRRGLSFAKYLVLSSPTRVKYLLARIGAYQKVAVFRSEYREARKAQENPQSALDGYFKHPVIQNLYDAAKSVKADIYLANDWHTIPVALRLAREHGGYLCYDTHEYAIEEYLHFWTWRRTRLPIAKAVEGIGLREAIVASTVSAGIGEDMARVYGLDKPLMEIRNVPNYSEVPYQPNVGDKIRVLYHGLVVKDRGLEDCVRSVKLWRDEFVFMMRGPISDEFKAELTKIARENGVEDRVFFLPPVPMLDLIKSAASEADIGISTPPKLSRHHIFALPNKFFEYIQAGLALCIADLPDMGKIVKQYDLGLLIPEVDAELIAKTINSFTRESVNQYKQNSLKAARELNWEVEAQKLLSAYDHALAARGR